MPLYGVPQAGSNPTLGLNLTSLGVGEALKLFNAETVAAGQSSVAFSRAPSMGGDDAGTTFQMSWASAPTAVITIQGSNTDLDAYYENLWTSTSTQYDNYTDTTRWLYYRVHVTSYSAGGALTVIAQR